MSTTILIHTALEAFERVCLLTLGLRAYVRTSLLSITYVRLQLAGS